MTSSHANFKQNRNVDVTNNKKCVLQLRNVDFVSFVLIIHWFSFLGHMT